MKIIINLLLVFFVSLAVYAQQGSRVTGQLIDNGKKLSNQRIILFTQTQMFETTTDSRGYYAFENIPDGNYLLKYGSKSASVKVKGGKVTTFKFGEVVIVPTGNSQPLSDVSKTVNIIENREIKDRNEFALGIMLSTVPGFRFQQLGGFGRLASIKTRGLRNQDTAVLVDGFRFRDSTTISGDSSSFLSNLTLPIVGKVEILRGSGSSLYGTNAIGGVIDFQSPEPNSEFSGGALGEYGSLGMTRFQGDVGAGTKNGRAGFNLGVSRIDFTEGIDREDDADNLGVRGRADFNPSSKTNISGRIYASDASVRLNLSPTTKGALPDIKQIINANPDVNFISDLNDPDSLQMSNFFSKQISLTQVINSQLVSKTGYQWLKTSRKNKNGPLGTGFQPRGGTRVTKSDGQIHTFNTKVMWIPSSSYIMTLGYEYELEKYENVGTGPTSNGNSSTSVDQSSNVFFVQDVLGLLDDKLQIAGGFRVQWFSLSQPTFSVNNAPYSNIKLSNPKKAYTFDGSASYYFTATETKVRVHVGNGYRVPSLFERFGTFFSLFSQSFTALGDPNLESENSVAFDVGLDQRLANGNVKLSATYFYTRLLDTIGFTRPASSIGKTKRPFGGYFNNRGGLSRGIELSGDFKVSGETSIFTSYTFTNSDQRESQLAGSGLLQTLGIADHQFTLVATQQFGRRATVNFDFLATSSYLAPIFGSSTRIYRFNGIKKGDLTGRYEFPAFDEKVQLSFFGTLENIFDNEYYENGFRTAGRTGRVGLSLRF